MLQLKYLTMLHLHPQPPILCCAEHGLRPADVYGGPAGVVAQLRSLEAWFRRQREFQFYSASVLILYEGDATGSEDAYVRVRLVDFAHTFRVGGETREDGGGDADAGAGAGGEPGGEPVGDGGAALDDNFRAGLGSLITRLTAVSRFDIADTLL